MFSVPKTSGSHSHKGVDLMEGVLYLTGKGYKLNMIQLIGTFILFIGILGLFVSISNFYQDWSAMNNLDDCYASAEDNFGIYECKDEFYKETGMILASNQPAPTSSQSVMILFSPLMWLLWWIAVSLFGIFLYNLGHRLVALTFKDAKELTHNQEPKRNFARK